MKKELLLIVLVLCLSLSLSLISSFDITLPKTTFAPTETMQVEIPNAFVDNLKVTNLLIYAKDAAHPSPAETGLIKYNDKYHFYAILPREPGEYSLRIEGAKYWDGSVQSEQPIIANFTIAQTNESYLSFNPGFIYTSGSFSISIQAYNRDQTVNVEFPEINFKQSFSLGYGESKIIYFNVGNVAQQINSNIKINDYNIPVVILSGSAKPSPNISTSPGEGDQSLKDLIASDTETINGTVQPGIDNYYQIVIVNKDKNVLNLKLSSSDPEIKVLPVFIDSLYKEQIINVTINTARDIDGYVRLATNNSAMTIPIKLALAASATTPTDTNVPTINQERTCANFGGIICASGETCSGSRTSSVDSPDGNCCIGDCSVKSSSAGYWIWGILILAVLGFIGWFLYKKANRGEGPEFLQKAFKKQTTDYQKRMNPRLPPPTEVRRSLSKL